MSLLVSSIARGLTSTISKAISSWWSSNIERNSPYSARHTVVARPMWPPISSVIQLSDKIQSADLSGFLFEIRSLGGEGFKSHHQKINIIACLMIENTWVDEVRGDGRGCVMLFWREKNERRTSFSFYSSRFISLFCSSSLVFSFLCRDLRFKKQRPSSIYPWPR